MVAVPIIASVVGAGIQRPCNDTPLRQILSVGEGGLEWLVRRATMAVSNSGAPTHWTSARPTVRGGFLVSCYPEIVLAAVRVESLRVMSMKVAEWGEKLTESLADGPGAPALLTLAQCADAAASEEVMAIARRAVTDADWPLCELTPDQIEGIPFPPKESGFLILRDVIAPLPPKLPILVAAFQHLVRRGKPVGFTSGGHPGGH